MEKPKKGIQRLLLLDTHAILHRAYHALPDFTSPSGEPTGALYGLVTMLLKAYDEIKPTHVIACYDLPQPTLRHQQFGAYKAGRAETDEELVHQIIRSKELLDSFSIPRYELIGFEADDLLATIVEKFSKDDSIEIVIASGDMDTLQLIHGKKVRVYTLKKGIKDTIIYDEDAVKERFGFGPLTLPDYKGLRGDPSDNIPGIKGIGEKTALIILSTFESIDDLYKGFETNNDETVARLKTAGLTDRMVNLLKDSQDDAEFSKMLATVRRDAEIEVVLSKEDWIKTIDDSRLIQSFQELGFRSLISKMDTFLRMKHGPEDMFASSAIIDKNDRETLHNNENNKGENLNGSVNSFHDALTNDFIINNSSTSSEKSDLFSVSQEKKHHQIDLESLQWKEIKVMAWLINSDRSNPEPFIINEIIHSILDLEDSDTKKNIASIQDVYDVLHENILNENLTNVWDNIEKPLIPVVDDMNNRGVALDTKVLKKLSKTYSDELGAIKKNIYTITGKEFNISSPKQLGEILFETLDLGKKGIKKTSTGKLSTAEKELEKLRDIHPLIDQILEYRELTKLLSTYIDSFQKLVHEDGRLYTNFVQTGTTTGRISSQSPNLQNIPIRSERGAPIRNAFSSQEGNLLLALDYSQIELRIAAMLSGDEKLIDTFKSGEDIHTKVASEMFGVEIAEVTKSQRSAAKTINFGILYGMGVNAVKDNLGNETTREDAQFFLNRYNESFPQLMEYMESTKRFAKKNGYTLTYFGRKRRFTMINSKLPALRAQAERMAINAPIQGTQADIIKKAMIEVDKYLQEENLVSKNTGLVMQVHDEVVFELPEERVKECGLRIKEIMESVLSIEETCGIVFKAEAKVGKNWGEMEQLQ